MKKIGVLLSLLLLALAVAVGWFSLRPRESGMKQLLEVTEAAVAAAPLETDGTAYRSPVDFEALRAINPDIYAWLYIPGVGVNCPVCMHSENGEYYLNHNSAREEDAGGAVFAQAKYNDRQFSYPVNVLYGDRRQLFAELQEVYSSEEALREYGDILVYLPDQVIHYSVYAAFPHSDEHLLARHDMKYLNSRENLLSAAAGRVIGAYINSAMTATTEDEFLVLSTGLSGNSQKRYLILAKKDIR